MRVLSLAFVLLLAGLLGAPSTEPLPLDPMVRSGRLPNGLVWYVRSNAKPEKRFSLRLAVKAGSVMEDDDQQGMAHFIEHMGFNGTTRFAKNDLVHWLQSVGVAFGPEINAYTSFDRTVYMLDLPSDKPEIVTKGFEIMADWAQGMTFDTNEMAKERGVVLEEWRMGQGADDRAMRKWLPVLDPGSRYAARFPIGTKESILGSPNEAIRRFYADWYRADRMALVAVGDLPVEELEARIRKAMAGLQGGSRRAEPIARSGKDRADWAVCRVDDKEFPNHSVAISSLLPEESTLTAADWRRQLARDLALSALRERFEDLARSTPPPFLSHQIFCGSFGLGRRDVFLLGLDVAETNLAAGLSLLLTERRRAELHGFGAGAIERAKKNLLNGLKRRVEEKTKTDSAGLAGSYVGHFSTGDALPGVEKELALANEILPTLDAKEVHRAFLELLKAGNPNVLFQIIAKPGVKVPSDAEALEAVRRLANADVPALVEKAISTRLVEKVPTPVAVTTKKLAEGLFELTFANGVKAILKPTTFQSNQILMSAWAPGGLSLVSDADWLSVSLAPQIMDACGLGAFRSGDLEKMLAGKTVGLDPALDETSHGLRGQCAREELGTLLELTWLQLLSPRKDDTDFKGWLTRTKEAMANAGRDPGTAFVDHLVRDMYANHLRAPVALRSESELGKVDLDRALAGWKSLAGDASGMTFFFVGSFDLEAITPLLATWLGNLPSSKSPRTWKDVGLKIGDGPKTDTFLRGGDPKAMVRVFQEKPATWTADDAHVAAALGGIVQRRLLDRVREELGGVYTIGIQTRLDRRPRQRAVLQLSFPCAPSNAERLTRASLEELAKVAEGDLGAEDLQKELETERRNLEKDLLQNASWRSRLQAAWALDGGDLRRVVDPKSFLDKVTAENLKRVARFFVADRARVYRWLPEAGAK